MSSDVTRDFPAARRVTDVDRIFQIKRFDELCEIVGESIHIVAEPGLTGTTMPATIMRDAAIAVRREKEHLVLERIRRERPTVTENNRLARAPVVVKNLRPVLR